MGPAGPSERLGPGLGESQGAWRWERVRGWAAADRLKGLPGNGRRVRHGSQREPICHRNRNHRRRPDHCTGTEVAVTTTRPTRSWIAGVGPGGGTGQDREGTALEVLGGEPLVQLITSQLDVAISLDADRPQRGCSDPYRPEGRLRRPGRAPPPPPARWPDAVGAVARRTARRSTAGTVRHTWGPGPAQARRAVEPVAHRPEPYSPPRAAVVWQPCQWV